MRTLVVGLGPWLDREVFLHGELPTFRDVRAFFREGVLRSFTPNLSCIAVASCLRSLGRDVEYLDLPLEFGIPFSDARRREWQARMRRHLRGRRCDAVFLCCVSSAEHRTLALTAPMFREAWPAAVLGVGSYHANTVREVLLDEIPELDFVFLGDLEPAARELMRALEERDPAALRALPNVLLRGAPSARRSGAPSARGNGARTPGPRPAALPRARAESRFDYEVCARYLPRYDSLAALASKGCPFVCDFCQEKVVRRSYDVRAPEAVVEETEYNYDLYEKHCGHRDVAYGYMDPMFGLNASWTRAFCAALEARPRRFAWGFQTRVGACSPATWQRFAALGCSVAYLGLESFSPAMLLRMHKTRQPARYLAQFREDLTRAERLGIVVEANVLFGHPGETRATLAETSEGIAWLEANHPGVSLNLNLFRPLPDTESALAASTEPGCELLADGWWRRGVLAGASVIVKPSAELEPEDLLRFCAAAYDDGRAWARRGVSAALCRFFDDGEIPPQALDGVGSAIRARVMAAMRNPAAREVR